MRRVLASDAQTMRVELLVPPIVASPRVAHSALSPDDLQSTAEFLAMILTRALAEASTENHVRRIVDAALRRLPPDEIPRVLLHAEQVACLGDTEALAVEVSPGLVPGDVIIEAHERTFDARLRVQLLRAVQQCLEEACA